MLVAVPGSAPFPFYDPAGTEAENAERAQRFTGAVPPTIHGLIVCAVPRFPARLLLTPQGCIHVVHEESCYRPGETNSFGRTIFTADPAQVEEQCRALLATTTVRAAIRKILRNVQPGDTHGRGVLDSYDIPLKLCVGRTSNLSPQLVTYLDAPKPVRHQMENALELLRTGKAGRGSQRQYEVVMACYFGTVPQAWVADAWGISRSAVNQILHKGRSFLESMTAFERGA